jgi:hypothetical protein
MQNIVSMSIIAMRRPSVHVSRVRVVAPERAARARVEVHQRRLGVPVDEGRAREVRARLGLVQRHLQPLRDDARHAGVGEPDLGVDARPDTEFVHAPHEAQLDPVIRDSLLRFLFALVFGRNGHARDQPG